jgi:hypothetical protein
MKKITIEIELDNVITAKQLPVPTDLIYDVKLNQYIRDYYKDLGYKVGNYIRVC